MGFLDSLLRFAESAARSTASKRDDAIRRIEREHPNMNSQSRARLEEEKRKTERLASFGGSYSSSSCSNGEIMGKTVSEWDSCWKSIGMLKNADLSPYNHCVGLYRHVVGGVTKYVGRAIELNNGGFRKRLSDYRRESGSARKHSSGQKIYEHLDEIHTYILVVGDTEEAVAATKRLEGLFVRKYNPEWNKQLNI